MGLQNIVKSKISEVVYSFLAAFSLIMPLAAALSQHRHSREGEWKEEPQTHAAGLCFPSGAAGGKNDRDYVATCPEAKC